MKNRINWDEYAVRLAQVASMRSEDPFVKVGACALRWDNSVASLGYNGAPPGIEIDWSNRDERRKRVCHAEVSCLRYVKPGECRLLALTISPCPACATVIASYKIPRIVYLADYENDKDGLGLRLCWEFGITADKIALTPDSNLY